LHFFNAHSPSHLYTLSLHDALPISHLQRDSEPSQAAATVAYQGITVSSRVIFKSRATLALPSAKRNPPPAFCAARKHWMMMFTPVLSICSTPVRSKINFLSFR